MPPAGGYPRAMTVMPMRRERCLGPARPSAVHLQNDRSAMTHRGRRKQPGQANGQGIGEAVAIAL
jgi:hypothetical protein